jgi:hypothetical protein
MRYFRSILVPVTAVLATLIGFSTVPGQVRLKRRATTDGLNAGDVNRISHTDDAMFFTWVKKEEILRAPSWDTSADNPPLSARKAQQLATKEIEAHPPDSNPWVLSRINLINSGDGLHWVYAVAFEEEPENHGHTGNLREWEIIVLMDGRVFEPVEQKRWKR